MAYSAEESSSISLIFESCCVCDKEFLSDEELANHLISHSKEEEFRIGLLELEKKSPCKVPNPALNSFPTSQKIKSGKELKPLKRTASQRASSPEVWEIISDDSDDESGDKNKKSAKTSNSFRLD